MSEHDDSKPLATQPLNPHLTSWGNPDTHPDLRTARSMNRFLRRCVLAGEVAAWIVGPLFIATAIGGLFGINFEQGRISDGTDYSCYIDGEGLVVSGR